jgi:mRNA-degrading endonuclease RelE of RelBE toxin-antitoxin system
MAKAPPFKIIFTEQVYEHLEHIDSKDYKVIQETILEQLSFTPTHVTCNRKPLEPPAPLESTWEIRFGSQNALRVFYDVDLELRVVTIMGIGIKIGNRLLIAGQEYE